MALANFEKALESKNSSPDLRADILEELAFVLSVLKRYKEALSARTESFSLRDKTTLTLQAKSQALVEIAALQKQSGFYAAAVATFAAAREHTGVPVDAEVLQ